MKTILWHSHPTVTALLLLRDPSRLPLATKAVQCFEAQDWPLRNLLVVNTTSTALTPQDLWLPARALGWLKNMAVACATGEWCVWWSDDAWFAPGYLRAHMEAAGKKRITVASKVSAYGVDSQRRLDYRQGTLTGFFRLTAPEYPDDGADEPFSRKFDDCYCLDCRELVLKFVREHSASLGRLPQDQLPAHPS